MKKRVFLQNSIILIFGILFFTVLIAACLYLIINFFIVTIISATFTNWLLEVIVPLSVICLLLFFILNLSHIKVVFKDKEIYVPGHWNAKDSKIQYETHILYEEIKDIFIVVSTKNSLGKDIRFVLTPIPYIVFEMKDNSQKAINVLYYSKKRTIEIIDEVRSRISKLDFECQIKSGKEILSEFLNHMKRDTKKL